MKITSQLRSDPDLALLVTVMNLFVLTEITNKLHFLQYACSEKSAGKSVRSLIQPDSGNNWFERLLEMPIVPLNCALRQFDSFDYLSCKYFMLDLSILEIRSYFYVWLIRDNCKNLQDNTI